jgi:cbb3-type cytochrome oxidase subunit 3
MIDTLVGIITAIAFGCLLYWAFRPSVRKWFEFPKYKMLEDERRFSEADTERDPREGERPRN